MPFDSATHGDFTAPRSQRGIKWEGLSGSSAAGGRRGGAYGFLRLPRSPPTNAAVWSSLPLALRTTCQRTHGTTARLASGTPDAFVSSASAAIRSRCQRRKL
jgi:hypothetical protein